MFQNLKRELLPKGIYGAYEYENMYVIQTNIKQQLVGGFNPFEKYSSIGMTITSIWENKSNVPNHHHGDTMGRFLRNISEHQDLMS